MILGAIAAIKVRRCTWVLPLRRLQRAFFFVGAGLFFLTDHQPLEALNREPSSWWNRSVGSALRVGWTLKELFRPDFSFSGYGLVPAPE